MPIRCFWELSRNINRISAQNDLRALSVARYSQSYSQEHITEFRDKLIIEMGEVFEYKVTKEQIESEQLDRAGLHSL